jgi:Xaa-Pro aminopeptidase
MRRIKGGVAIFPSAPADLRNSDVEHPYRQDTDLYYLTGFEEPNAVALLAPDHPEHKFVLFVQPKDRERELWTGRRAGPEGATRDYGADAAFTIDKLDEELPKLAEKADRIYYRFGNDPSFDTRLVGFMRRFQRQRQREGTGPTSVIDPAELLHEMRLIKTPDDLALLRRAVDISCKGHLAAIEALRPGAYEYELDAAIGYAFRKSGSPRCGYATIVGAGANATVLYYTGDVTRTLPASGKFTEDQAVLYQLVLDAQLAAIDAIRPDATFIEPHNRAVRVLTEGLARLGLLDGDTDKLIDEDAVKKFYMHRTSHWLGMDVHDAGPYKVADEWRRLAPGMVMTVEPGLYISEDLESVPPRYRGIGIRIEDDVLVTEHGCEVLSARLPKTITDIEGAMTNASL